MMLNLFTPDIKSKDFKVSAWLCAGFLIAVITLVILEAKGINLPSNWMEVFTFFITLAFPLFFKAFIMHYKKGVKVFIFLTIYTLLLILLGLPTIILNSEIVEQFKSAEGFEYYDFFVVYPLFSLFLFIMSLFLVAFNVYSVNELREDNNVEKTKDKEKQTDLPIPTEDEYETLSIARIIPRSETLMDNHKVLYKPSASVTTILNIRLHEIKNNSEAHIKREWEHLKNNKYEGYEQEEAIKKEEYHAIQKAMQNYNDTLRKGLDTVRKDDNYVLEES